MDNGMSDYANRCIDWLLSGDVGASSESIFRIITNKYSRGLYEPSDFADFGRCFRLLKLFPEWKNKLHLVANESTIWNRIIKSWDYLCAEYEKIDMRDNESKLNFNQILWGVWDEPVN